MLTYYFRPKEPSEVFLVSPPAVVFTDYKIGQVYEVRAVLVNNMQRLIIIHTLYSDGLITIYISNYTKKTMLKEKVDLSRLLHMV